MTFAQQLQQKYPSANFLDNEPIKINSLGDYLNEMDQVLNQRPVVAYLGQYGLLSVDGDDATDFLHKQLTNDVQHLSEGIGRHAAWCSAKGRMLASMLVFRQENSLRLLLSRDLTEQTRKRLQMYILRAKAKATDLTESVEIFGFAGISAETLLQNAGYPLPPASNEPTIASMGNTTVVRFNDCSVGSFSRFMLIVTAQEAWSHWEVLSNCAAPVGVPAWQLLEIQAGQPVITQATYEAFVPQMVDFDALGGVSFKKGCYPGQEIVARAHYLGKVKRHLYRVASTVAMQSGDSLYSKSSPDQAIGMIVSAVQTSPETWVGLASIVESAVDELTVPLQCSRVFNETAQQ